MNHTVILAASDVIKLGPMQDVDKSNVWGWLFAVGIVIGVLMALLSFNKANSAVSAVGDKVPIAPFILIGIGFIIAAVSVTGLVKAQPWERYHITGYDQNIAKIEQFYNVTNLNVHEGENLVKLVTDGKTGNDYDYSSATWTNKKGESVSGYVVCRGDKSTNLYLSIDEQDLKPYEKQ